MIVAGFGFRTAATAQSLADALAATGFPESLDACATASDKAETAVMQDFCQAQNLTCTAISEQELQAAQTQTHSAFSQQSRKTGSVAEAAALSAAGPGARLLVTRHISNDRMATCAIAQGPNL